VGAALSPATRPMIAARFLFAVVEDRKIQGSSRSARFPTASRCAHISPSVGQARSARVWPSSRASAFGEPKRALPPPMSSTPVSSPLPQAARPVFAASGRVPDGSRKRVELSSTGCFPDQVAKEQGVRPLAAFVGGQAREIKKRRHTGVGKRVRSARFQRRQLGLRSSALATHPSPHLASCSLAGATLGRDKGALHASGRMPRDGADVLVASLP
jgi:hypothetical protein